MPEPIKPPPPTPAVDWPSILAAVATLSEQVAVALPPPWSAVVVGIAAAALTISRELSKDGAVAR